MVLVFGLMSDRVFFPPRLKRRPCQTLTARPRVAASLRCPCEEAERDHRTQLCPRPTKDDKTPSGAVDLTPEGPLQEEGATGGAALKRNK